ncbi:hypothetical protein [Nocardiopsis coralliicola]
MNADRPLPGDPRPQDPATPSPAPAPPSPAGDGGAGAGAPGGAQHPPGPGGAGDCRAEAAEEPPPYQVATPEQKEIWETKGQRAVGFGIAWALGGLGVSFTTYAAAADGGVYLLAWGPVVYGAYRIISGVLLLRKA